MPPAEEPAGAAGGDEGDKPDEGKKPDDAKKKGDAPK
jgi:hypothetical protein